MAEVHRHRGHRKKLTEAAIWWARGCPGADVEKDLERLREEEGWNETALAIERAEQEAHAAPRLIWPENWNAARVFESCKWTKLLGLKGLYWDHISATEITSACVLLKIPRKEWDQVFDRVRAMEIAAKPVLNEDK